MERTSSINAYQSPTLWVNIDDLHIPCAVPDVATVERIMEKAGRVTGFKGRLTREQYDYTFDLFAEVLSCNHDYLDYTPEDLKAKKVTITQIMGVLADWVQFIGELPNLKN